jgi:hypothetical protein
MVGKKTLGTIRCGLEDNIKIDFRETGCHVAQAHNLGGDVGSLFHPGSQKDPCKALAMAGNPCQTLGKAKELWG